mmetsp:Transcript_31547/g.100607  ORF Transcript_31547/g.100607 Transcript_31547/m.100607 type:complete len:314 (+) Transcript_31547:216-1157(+)
MTTWAVLLVAALLYSAMPPAVSQHYRRSFVRGPTNQRNSPYLNAHCVHCTLSDPFMRNMTMNVDRVRPQWYPVPWARVTLWKNVAPFWHANSKGLVNGEDSMLVGHNFVRDVHNGKEPRFEAPADVAFIVNHNRPGDSMLEASLRAHKIKYMRLGRSYRPWDFFGKFQPVLKAIKAGKITEKYLVYMDARDTFLAKDPAHLVEDFLMYDADLLLASTGRDEPANPVQRRFEMRVSPWSHYHNYVSTGGYMAKTEALVPLLEELEKSHWRNKIHKCPNEDNSQVRCFHMKFYPRVKVDSLSVLLSEHEPHMDQL